LCYPRLNPHIVTLLSKAATHDSSNNLLLFQARDEEVATVIIEIACSGASQTFGYYYSTSSGENRNKRNK